MPAPRELGLHPAAARAELLLRDRERLLREIEKKKRQLAQVKAKASRDAEEAVSVMTPLVARERKLRTSLHALFEELLAPGRLSTRARNQVAKVRRSLELQGVLDPRGLDEDPAPPSNDEREPPGFDPDDDFDYEPVRGNVKSAPQPAPERRSLREIFRNVVRAIHPDQARAEDERARRTELMKEATRAYEEGDLAKLIALEASSQGERPVVDGMDSLARCKELERINRELLKQTRELTRELRDTKRDALEASHGLPPQELLNQATRELDGVERIFDFVRQFRDGKISLAALLRGPPVS